MPSARDHRKLPAFSMAIALNNMTQGLTSASVQLFLAWRIHILSSNVFLVIGISLLAVTSTGESLDIDPSSMDARMASVCGIATSVAVNATATFGEFFRKFVSIVIIWLAASAADNLVITTTLVRLLVCSIFSCIRRQPLQFSPRGITARALLIQITLSKM